jgi:hypothetical protein
MFMKPPLFTCIGTELHTISYQSIMEAEADICIQVYININLYTCTYTNRYF